MRVIQTASETVSTRYFHTDHLRLDLGDHATRTAQWCRSWPSKLRRLGQAAFPEWLRRSDGQHHQPDHPWFHGPGRTLGRQPRPSQRPGLRSSAGAVHFCGHHYGKPLRPAGLKSAFYVGNAPLTFTDPSGQCFLGCFWQHISSAISSVAHAVTSFIAHNPIVRAVVQIAATAVLNVVPALRPWIRGESSRPRLRLRRRRAAIATGLSGGNLGQILKASAIAGVTAAGFWRRKQHSR